ARDLAALGGAGPAAARRALAGAGTFPPEKEGLMGWAIMAAFALLAGAGLFWFARRDKGALQFLAAALLLALAGYAWEGHPSMAGSPKAPPAHQQIRDNDFQTLHPDLLGRFD